MVAALALMDSPTIITGLILGRFFTGTKKKNQANTEGNFPCSEVLGEAFLNGSVFLLLGSLVVGMVTSEKMAGID